MKVNQFAIYQLKSGAETREIRFRTYEYMMEHKLPVSVSNYQEVYIAALFPRDTPETIRERFTKLLPKGFQGHSLSVSDVLVLNRDGVVTAYYIDKDGLVVLAGFLRLNSSGSLVTIETEGFRIEGRGGTWMAADEIVIDGRQFFLMQHEQYQNQAAFAVVDGNGKQVAEDTKTGFDETTQQRIREYLHPPAPMPAANSAIPAASKPPLELYQKYYENGEYIRAVESGTEQNYNMVDGIANNRKGKPRIIGGRASVLDRLRQKQEEIAVRSGKSVPLMETSADMERNRK